MRPHSPQSRPKTSCFPPLTAASTASANSLKATTSSPSSVVLDGSVISGALTPNACWNASSRSRPRSLSIEVKRAGRFWWDERILRIAGDVAGEGCKLGGGNGGMELHTDCFILVELERFGVIALEGIRVGGFFGDVGPVQGCKCPEGLLFL